jgi:hypothetical protein
VKIEGNDINVEHLAERNKELQGSLIVLFLVMADDWHKYWYKNRLS